MEEILQLTYQAGFKKQSYYINMALLSDIHTTNDNLVIVFVNIPLHKLMYKFINNVVYQL